MSEGKCCNHDCNQGRDCPVRTGTHKPAEAVHQIDDPSPVLAAQPATNHSETPNSSTITVPRGWKLVPDDATPEWIANLESSPVWSEAVGECIKKFLAAVAVPAMTQIRALHINKPEDDGKRWREVSSGRAAQLVSDNPGVYQTRQLFAAASAVDVPMVDMTPPALPATEDSSTGDLAALIKKFRAVLTAEIHASIDPSSDIARQEGAIDTADHLLAEFNKIFPEA